MTNSPNIVEATATRYNSLVLKNSGHAQESTGAMEQLPVIERRERTFRDNAGRKEQIAVINFPGQKEVTLSNYRSLLTEALN